ncbi:hypothetical protein [Parasphingorhabdus sp.]|uniref:hypothetical protein n=1 Tax=Parasphingorhabdus sp. TaxID=2709688 RepID=UPI003C77C712
MNPEITAWHIGHDSALKRMVRIEVIGKSFALFEQQWRSEAYFFGDLVYRGKEGRSHVFGLEDGIKARPKWKLGFQGEIPAELTTLLPQPKQPMKSNIGLMIVAIVCLAIVYFSVF